MTLNSPSAREPVPLERPTSFAELEVRVGPVPWGKAKGRVAPDQATYLIMTFGILGSVVTGTAGAVLTLRIAPRLTGLALAELVLALAAALIIAVCRLSREQAPYPKSNRRQMARADNQEGGTTGS
jgi:uncharacterized membrane protein YeaQ/YmgE (transglycosylase-associated protein family)